MAKRKQRAARLATVALLSTTVFANPPPPVGAKKPVMNRPGPKKPVDAGTPENEVELPTASPVIVNVMRAPEDGTRILPDGGLERGGK
ncbi:MAG: hypothetical protein GQE15_17550 [Archangiaceae bacterium]|nr:hypothetical protein [Archangiaceae bacterium]